MLPVYVRDDAPDLSYYRHIIVPVTTQRTAIVAVNKVVSPTGGTVTAMNSLRQSTALDTPAPAVKATGLMTTQDSQKHGKIVLYIGVAALVLLALRS